MKKNFYIVSTLVASSLLLFSCAKNESEAPLSNNENEVSTSPSSKIELVASLPEEATKVALSEETNDNGQYYGKLAWAEDDVITVYYNNGNSSTKFTLEEGAGTKSAKFKSEKDVEWTNGTSLVAIVGENSEFYFDEQEGTLDYCAKNTPMSSEVVTYKEGEALSFSFNNLASILKINIGIPSDGNAVTVYSVNISSKETSDLSTSGQIKKDDGTWSDYGGSNVEIATTEMNTEIKAGETKSVYLVMPDGIEFPKDDPMVITVNCTDSDPLIAIANGDISFEKGYFYTIDVEPSLWQQYIKLEDKKVGKILVEETLTDAEGNTISNLIYYDGVDYYLSTTKAAKVTDIGTIFSGTEAEPSKIKTFNEFKYFTGVKSLDALAFAYCSSLTSIEIPSGVTSLGDRVFKACTSLTTVYCYPTTPPSAGEELFVDCSALNAIYVPSGKASEESTTTIVEDYQAADNWSTYSAKIQAMSE